MKCNSIDVMRKLRISSRAGFLEYQSLKPLILKNPPSFAKQLAKVASGSLERYHHHPWWLHKKHEKTQESKIKQNCIGVYDCRLNAENKNLPRTNCFVVSGALERIVSILLCVTCNIVFVGVVVAAGIVVVVVVIFVVVGAFVQEGVDWYSGNNPSCSFKGFT